MSARSDASPPSSTSPIGLAEPAPTTKSLGVQRLTHVSRRLEFPENNFIKMYYVSTVEFIVESDTRLYEHQYSWTGQGPHGRPVIEAWEDGSPMSGVHLHGPVWEEAGVFSYLIDLAKTVDPGRSVKIESKQTFIDEGGTFEHRLSLSNLHDYAMNLSIGSVKKPLNPFYSFESNVSREESGNVPLEVGPGPSPYRFEFSYTPESSSRGKHQLTWEVKGD